MKKSIGIIGNGFVGESQAFAFSPTAYVRIFDIDPLKATHTLEENIRTRICVYMLTHTNDYGWGSRYFVY
jgi:3-hydroxyacyl-CoA dehydrogenase